MAKYKPHILICIGLLILTGIVFSGVMGNDFILYDDKDYITENTHVQSGLSVPGITWAFKSTWAANYHPLTWLSHMADCSMFGLDPEGHHFTSYLFHLLNTVLVFLLLAKITGKLWPSALVAALFGVHPLHVESVAWIAERKDVLSTFFWLLTMMGYAFYCAKPNAKRYAVMALFFVLGLLSKPMLVTLPLVLLIMDFWPLERVAKGWKSLILEKLPLLAIAAAFSIVTFIAQRGSSAVMPFEQFPMGERISNAIVSYAAYLVKMVWPTNLAVFYPHPGSSLPVWQIAGAAVLFVAVSVLAWRLKSRKPYVLSGWLWYVLTCLPIIGIAQVGGQAMADRYTYVPLLGIFVIVAWAAGDLFERKTISRVPVDAFSRKKRGDAAFVEREVSSVSPVFFVLSGLALVALSAVTYAQIGYWQDNRTLMEHAIAVTKGNYTAHNSLGLSFQKEGNTEGALEQYNETLKLRPNHSEAHNNLGTLFGENGQPDEAIAQFTRAIESNPAYAEAYYNRATALLGTKHLREAVDDFQKALALRPDYPKAYSNLAVAMFFAGNFKAAWDNVHEAQRMGFDPPEKFIEALSQQMPEP